MKFRLDFVTNSSSSCYVCDICGNAQEVYDGCSLSEVGMSECECGHIFCEDEVLPTTKTKEEIISELLALGLDEDSDFFEDIVDNFLQGLDADGEYINSDCCPICQFQHWTDYDMKNYLGKKYGFTFQDYLKEFRQTYGPNRIAKESEYFAYMSKRFGFELSDIMEEWKQLFKNFKELRRYYNS